MKRNITYTEHEGRLYPDLELPEQEQMMIGRFGRKHKAYLKKCKRYESYKRTLHGWSHYRVIVRDMSTGKVAFNRMGRTLKKVLEKIN